MWCSYQTCRVIGPDTEEKNDVPNSCRSDPVQYASLLLKTFSPTLVIHDDCPDQWRASNSLTLTSEEMSAKAIQ